MPSTTNPSEGKTTTDSYLPVAQFTKGGQTPSATFSTSNKLNLPATCNLILELASSSSQGQPIKWQKPKIQKAFKLYMNSDHEFGILVYGIMLYTDHQKPQVVA